MLDCGTVGGSFVFGAFGLFGAFAGRVFRGAPGASGRDVVVLVGRPFAPVVPVTGSVDEPVLGGAYDGGTAGCAAGGGGAVGATGGGGACPEASDAMVDCAAKETRIAALLKEKMRSKGRLKAKLRIGCPFTLTSDAAGDVHVPPRFYFAWKKIWTKKNAFSRIFWTKMPVRKRTPATRAGVALLDTLLVAIICTQLYGCAPAHDHKKLEMQPIGTLPNVPRTPRDDPSDSGMTSPNSGTPSPGSAACASAIFENLEETLRQCEVAMPRSADVAALKDRLEVRISATASRIAPGGRVDVEITLRNRSNEPLPLYFTGDPVPRFDLETVDARGRRADLPATKFPGYPKGFKPEARETKAARITLEKSGTAKIRITWDALKSKWAPQTARSWEGRGFPRVPGGPLAAGKYTLRMLLPLLGDIDAAKVVVEVGS